MNNEKIIGYQIESADGKHDIPGIFCSWEIFKRKKDASLWLSKYKDKFPGDWQILPVRRGDIEEHKFIEYS